MRFIFAILFLSILFQKCKDSPKVISQKGIIKLDLNYAFPVRGIYYSLVFSAGDTVYVRDFGPLQKDTSFAAILTRDDRSKIDDLVNTLNLSSLDSSYDSGSIDGDGYHLSISKNDTLKTIDIRGGGVPAELISLIEYTTGLKERLSKHHQDKNN
jgi:hypothetical protein